jgi:pimeloyl-ACP methyl ester carboxylesterase
MQATPRFVWLHGFGSGPSSAKAAWVGARLRERGLSLEAPDLNEPAFFELTVARMLERLDALWAERSAPLVLCGSSLGGYTAALWAAAHPERVAALALLAPAFDLARRWAARMGEPALQRWRAQGWFEFDHYVRRRRERLSSRFLEDAQRHPAFPLPRAPTLVVQGLRDETVPPELAREFAARMEAAGHPVRLVELPEGHELTADLPGLWGELARHFGW